MVIASPDWDRAVVGRIPVSQEVVGTDGICKYLSSLSFILCYCMRAFFVSVCIN